MRHFLSLTDLTPEEMTYLIERAARLKADHALNPTDRPFSGKVLALLFEKPSMRTRVSFESAMAHLGGSCIFLNSSEVGLGKRESISDFAKVISTYVDALAVRTFSHDVVEELAQSATCPIINALSDFCHPCQALADMLTLHEQVGPLSQLKLAYLGDGNNVARSLALASVYAGVHLVVGTPKGFELDDDFLARCDKPGLPGRVEITTDPKEAIAGADAVYTDVWASMGQEKQAEERKKKFADWQVNSNLMSLAKPNARFMHCLPAHRDEEVSSDVIDGPNSIVVVQAENRLHAQKALLEWLLLGDQQMATSV